MYVLLSRTQAEPGRTVKARTGSNFSQPRTNLHFPLCTMQWRSCKRELSPYSGTCHLSSTASTYLQKTILATLSIYYLSRLYLLLRVCETARPWVCGQSVGRAVGWSNKWCDRDRGSESERGEGRQPASHGKGAI